jgi:hypothetical protein
MAKCTYRWIIEGMIITMRKAIVYILIFFVTTGFLLADEYEFHIHYRVKGRLSEHYDFSCKYSFEDRLLRVIEVKQASISGEIVETKRIELKHFEERTEAYQGGTLVIICRYIDANNIVFIRPELQNILATRAGNMVYIGMAEDVLDRTFHIKLGEEIQVRLLRNGKPINRHPSVDFDISGREESTIRYIEYPIKYEKIGEGVFEEVGYFDPEWPERFFRYVIASRAQNYDIHIAELFIEYYCGVLPISGEPFLWGQLIMGSENKLSPLYKVIE